MRCNLKACINTEPLMKEFFFLMISDFERASLLMEGIQASFYHYQAESGWNCSSILTLLGSGHQKHA
jgi:hypothetical protein